MPAAKHRRDLTDSTFDGVNHYVLTYHIGGGAVTRDDWRSPGPASTGALSLQRPGSGGQFTSHGVVEYAHFYFQPSLVDEVSDEVGLNSVGSGDDVFALNDPMATRDAQEYLRRATDEVDPPGAIEMDSRGYLLALSLLRAMQRQPTTSASVPDPGRADLRRVLVEIDERLAEPLRLSDLAASVHMSPFHFARVFKKVVGEPPGAYLQRRRTEHAIDLIRTSPLSLSEIAYRTGFSSQSHMTSRVKALTGTTPRKLRQD